MNMCVRLAASLAAAALATSCTIYMTKELEPEALAAKAEKAKIVGVRTAGGSLAFSEEDPAAVRDGAVQGNIYTTYTLDPWDIADIEAGPDSAAVVLKDGRRFRVTSSRPSGECVECETVRRVAVPVGEVVKAKIKKKDPVGSVFATLGAAVAVVGVAAVAAALGGGEEEEEDPFDPGDDFLGGLIDWSEDVPPAAPRLSNSALLNLARPYDTAGESEFWALEWAPVHALPDENGKLRLRLENVSGAPRGVDEAVLFVVDHPGGIAVAPDAMGRVVAYPDPNPPEEAVEGESRDIRELVATGDGLLWRTAGGDPPAGGPAPSHDAITLSFRKPKGALAAKLIVSASNSTWRSAYAREARVRRPAEAPDGYVESEFSKLKVRLWTAFGWQTAQVLFANGPLPAGDMIYDLDLCDVAAEEVRLMIAPPAGYWLFDRVALAFGKIVTVDNAVVAAESVEGPDGAEVLEALAAEDGTTVHLAGRDDPAVLTFAVPPPKEGKARSFFLRTVSCYEMPRKAVRRP